MERRDFLKTVSIAGTGLVIPDFLPAKTNNEDYSPDGFSLEDVSIRDLQLMMKEEIYSSQQLVTMFLSRIEEIDRKGPHLNSILELNPDATNIAMQLDNERKKGNVRGELHGIPVFIKGNIDTADKMHTNAGATALANSIPSSDAFVVKKLREAGAVILGKTNLSEWANFRSTRSSSGWSSMIGQTRNPYYLDRNPSGSSSGSAAAVSANLCAVAVGTETDGSVVSPSSINGLVGIKPTVGLISRSGIIPISFTCDTAGPMARTVSDAVILLSALAGEDENDKATINSARPSSTDYTKALDINGLKNARIGVARKFFGFHEEVDKVIEQAMSVLRSQGAILIELNDFVMPKEISDDQFTVLLYEFKYGVNKYLAGLPNAPVKTLSDVIEFNNKNAATAMPYFKQEILEKANAKDGLDSDEYLKALERMKQAAGKDGIDKAMNENQLDAIISPTDSAAWSIDLIDGDHYLGGSSSPAAMAGYPHITVPAGFIYELPIGISFYGRAWSEATLIKFAFAYAQATHHRAKPKFLKSIF
ncbi:MAG TPA: amidase [Chitinophagales bacterium]|nr:amidase [Chitinophagales bacterium]